MKRWQWIVFLGLVFVGTVASSFATNDFTIFDITDTTKIIKFDLAAVQTGSIYTLTIPDYGGGVIPLPIDEGTSGAILVSQGAGFAPSWSTSLGFVSGSLTATRVPFAQNSSTLIDSGDMTFAGDSLAATRLNSVKTIRVGGLNATNSNPLTVMAAVSQSSALTRWVGSAGQYLNQVDASGGFDFAKANATAQAADITTTTFASTMPAGEYMVTAILEDTAADITAGIVTVTFAWTDDAGATTDATLTQTLTGTGRSRISFPVYLASGTITYTTSHTGIFGTAQYALRARLSYLGS